MVDRSPSRTARTVLVTGAGKPGQVGEAIARAFAAGGDHVLLVSRSADEATAAARRIGAAGGAVTGYAADLGDHGDCLRLAAAVAGAHGPALDAVVHLAGGWIPGSRIAESGPEQWERVLRSNLLTAAYVAAAFLPAVRAARGAFVFFASEAALPGARVAGLAPYATAKRGVETVARAIDQEERTHGVRANVLAPGAIRTASNEAAMGTDAAYVEREEVARIVLWLCSADAGAVSGETLRLGAGAPRERHPGARGG